MTARAALCLHAFLFFTIAPSGDDVLCRFAARQPAGAMGGFVRQHDLALLARQTFAPVMAHGGAQILELAAGCLWRCGLCGIGAARLTVEICERHQAEIIKQLACATCDLFGLRGARRFVAQIERDHVGDQDLRGITFSTGRFVFFGDVVAEGFLQRGVRSACAVRRAEASAAFAVSVADNPACAFAQFA